MKSNEIKLMWKFRDNITIAQKKHTHTHIFTFYLLYFIPLPLSDKQISSYPNLMKEIHN